MNQPTAVAELLEVAFEIVGFDRTQFVSDVLAATSVPAQTRIAQATFEADGVRSTGRLTLRIIDPRHLHQISQQLQRVRGLVQVTRQTS